MKVIYIYLTILVLSILFNNYTLFGLIFVGGDSEKNMILWSFLYTVIFPIKSMLVIFDTYKFSSNFYKYLLFVFISYLTSLFFSSIVFLDFRSFRLRGDGGTKYVLYSIYFVAFVSSLSSLLFFLWRGRKIKILQE